MPHGLGVEVVETDRGGRSTYHAPGQLVCYPILDLNRHGRDVRKYCRDLEEAVIAHARRASASRARGSTASPASGSASPTAKIASIGVHIARWVTTHGFALNVDLDPAPFTDWITACGLEDAAFTTVGRELGRRVTVDETRPPRRRRAVADVFGLALEELPAGDGPRPLAAAGARARREEARPFRPSGGAPWSRAESLPVAERPRRPEWMKVRAPSRDSRYFEVRELLHGQRLATICEEARCPNIGECWGRGTATFQILGETCTRACRYCYVTLGPPGRAARPARAAAPRADREQMGLSHVVVTSVDRDDLPDRGAGHFAAVIRALAPARCPTRPSRCSTPDFLGVEEEALATVLAERPRGASTTTSRPCRRLHRRCAARRPTTTRRSGLLRRAEGGRRLPRADEVRDHRRARRDERRGARDDARPARARRRRRHDRPVPAPLARSTSPIDRWVHPDEFRAFREEGERMGFGSVFSGPLVALLLPAPTSSGARGRERPRAPPGRAPLPLDHRGARDLVLFAPAEPE